MKLLAPTLLLTLTAMAVPAVSYAACTGTTLSQGQLNTLLANNTVCGRPGPSYPGNQADRWQEQHRTGSQLWDYKQGPGSGVDPTKQVGDWSIANDSGIGLITHRYPAGGPTSFTWQVFGPNSNTPGSSIYSFCTTGSTPAEHAVAVVLTGETSCGTSYPAAGANNSSARVSSQSLKSAPAPALPGGKTK